MALRRIEDALQLLRAEYLDIPRLSLTPAEVARIVEVDPPTARLLLGALEDSRFLERTRDGRFVRVTPRSEIHNCALCGQDRIQGSLLQVADTDETEEALWMCRDCQHKLTCRIDDEGVQGG